MLPYLHSALDRLLLANVIGLRMVLSGPVSLGHVTPSRLLQGGTKSNPRCISFLAQGFVFFIEFHARIIFY